MLPAEVLAGYRQALEEYLRQSLDRAGAPLLYRMARYHLGLEDADGQPSAATGKGLRPALCLLSCQAAGKDWRWALPAAAAVELVHNFTLVHDDIQDRDRERRHRPTVWTIWGESQAINAGDALLALAQMELMRLQVPGDIVVRGSAALNERTLEVVEGQVLDLSFEERLDVDLLSYLDMIERKTGALFDCSLHLGALIGSEDDCLAEALGRCGRLLGISFQVRDDILGVWGTESQTGKAPAADIYRRKKSLPAVHAFSNARGQALEVLHTIYSRTELSPEDVATVLSLMDDLGTRGYCRNLCQERRQAALGQYDSLGLKTQAAKDLREVMSSLLEIGF